MTIMQGNASLAGRISVVTGGASGIGEACARRLFSLGSTVVISDVAEERGNAIVQELKNTVTDDSSKDAVFIKTDMSKGEETKELGRKVLEMFGAVSIQSYCFILLDFLH
jgi:NAD(P)-dependent dehydrogenase (short-subunit alcohol dehydrogenase family)